MRRTISEQLPEVPQLETSFPDTIAKTYNISVITPIFGGGAQTGTTDPVTLIRPFSIRGHLRFWWRATRGAHCQTVKELRQREGEIWGTTDNPSPINLVVNVIKRDDATPCATYEWNQRRREGRGGYDLEWKSPFEAQASPLPYALFPFQGSAPDSKVPCTPTLYVKSARFTLSLCIPTVQKLAALRPLYNARRQKAGLSLLTEQNDDIQKDVEAAVWAWINFGGIGARTRRGCGALFCTKVPPETLAFHPPSIDGFTQWRKEKAEQYGFPLLAKSAHRDWPTLPSTVCLKKSTKDALAAWSEGIGLLKQFRQGVNEGRDPGHMTPGRSRWPEAESVRTLVMSQRSLAARPSSWHGVDSRIPTSFFPRAELGMPIIFELRGEQIPYTTPGRNPPPSLKPSLQPSEKIDRMASPVILRPVCFSEKQTAAMVAVLNTTPLPGAYLKPSESGGRDLTSGVPLSPAQIKAPALAGYKDSPMGSPGSSKPPRSSSGSTLDAFVAFAEEKGFVKVKP